MKLELKHLTPYLPYGLRGIDYDKKTYLFRGLDNNGNVYWDCNEILNKKGYDIAPILRPLSDLTKDIEVNGEKFVPFDFFDEYYSPIDDYNELQKHFLNSDIKKMPYELIEKLFEWHFDVFGLIEQGLAIDINDLQHFQPC